MRALVILLFSLALGGVVSCSDSDSTPETTQPTSLPKTVTQTIGPEGGKIVLEGATVTFPPGAVPTPTAITITATDETPPAGFIALSKIYECGPSGTDFPQKVMMEMSFTPDDKPATMYWSSGADPSFTDVGGALSGTIMAAGVSHFSKGFVGRKE